MDSPERGQPRPGDTPAAGFAPARAPQGSERRRHLRRDVLNRELVAINLGANNGGLLLDLSEGGAAVQAVAPLEPTAASPFAFRLPELTSQIEGTGVWAWMDDSGLSGGLRFDRLSPNSQRLLEQWLKDKPVEITPEPEDEAPESVASGSEIGVPETGVPPVPSSAIPRSWLEPDVVATLKRAVERVCSLSGANGASIALKNEQGDFLCEASIGMAPDVGTALNLKRGLSAECVATGGLVLCNDAQNDPRVDASTRRHLSLGSAALLPLFVGKRLMGVLGVFSDQPHAFGEQGLRQLQGLARTMETDVQGGARGELKSARAASLARSRPGQDAVPPTRRNRRARLPASVLRMITAVLLGCAALFAGLVYYQRHFFPPALPTADLRPTAETSRSAATPALVPQGSPAAVPPITETAPPGPEQQTGTRSEAVEQPAREMKPAPRSAPLGPRNPTSAPRSPATARGTMVQQPLRTTAPEVTARQAPSAAGAAINPAPVPPQQIGVQREQSAPLLVPPDLPVVKPVPPPPAHHVDVVMSVLETRPKLEASASQIPTPQLVSRVEIHYPPAALAQKRQGSVILKVTVERGGIVDNILVLDGDELLTAEAVRAVRQWRYRPYQLAGHEVEADLLVTINFVLSPRE